jgi:hypothetical protein
MLYTCVERFDVIGGRENILGWDGEVNTPMSVAIVNKSLRSSTFTLTHAFDILTPQQLIKSSTRTKQRPHPIPSRRSPPNSVTDGQDRINGQGFLIGPRNKLLRGRQPFSKPEGPGCYFSLSLRSFSLRPVFFVPFFAFTPSAICDLPSRRRRRPTPSSGHRVAAPWIRGAPRLRIVSEVSSWLG